MLVYNRLQERSARRDAERSFASKHADVLLDGSDTRREPTFEPATEPAIEPTLGAEPEPAAAADESPSAPRPDPRIDYVVEVHDVPVSALRGEWPSLERRFGPRLLVSSGRDGAALVALQMVSRSGVVGEADLVDFRSRLESIAAEHGGTAAAPETRAALQAAQALDRGCAEVDVQIALHVLGVDGVELPESPGFNVARRADGITLLLDVPRTAELERSFDDMVRTARQIAAGQGGRLVDDNGNTLGERALAAIGVEVRALRARLAELGIEPGSPLALRLFS